MEKKLEEEITLLKNENIKLVKEKNELNQKIKKLNEEIISLKEDLETRIKAEIKNRDKIEILEKNIQDKVLFDNIVKSCNGEIKKLIEDLEKKVKLITQEKDNYLHKFDNLLTQKERLEDDFKELEDKYEEQLDINNSLGGIIEKYKNKENNNFNPEDYEIIYNKKINKLNWYLLKFKNVEENNYNYNDFVWVPELNINIENYNKFDNNEEQLNSILLKKLKDLEEKEDYISKLTFENEKLKKRNSRQLSEINNYDNPYISNTDYGNNINNNVPLEKYIQIINDYNNLDMKYSKLKINYKELIEKLKTYENTFSYPVDDDTLIFKKNGEINIENNHNGNKFNDLCIFIKELLSKININNDIEDIYNKINDIIDIKNE